MSTYLSGELILILQITFISYMVLYIYLLCLHEVAGNNIHINREEEESMYLIIILQTFIRNQEINSQKSYNLQCTVCRLLLLRYCWDKKKYHNIQTIEISSINLQCFVIIRI